MNVRIPPATYQRPMNAWMSMGRLIARRGRFRSAAIASSEDGGGGRDAALDHSSSIAIMRSISAVLFFV
eukprot:CAMPEP_0205906068 /NCGR_PEP_ID=MMETSP1325-20131115/1730_1 /ASSEMBLY_ACC=CAM_ASM_000708 /TAXON_ID=236786 /ORGANISM="Florenciella sp., Strain RCC1007" /LENGTH=68 /DNA_ID=CAMNT_0053272047 /DNA_START=676 /DNA_END=882 /DNA_ORIENTATION=+